MRYALFAMIMFVASRAAATDVMPSPSPAPDFGHVRQVAEAGMKSDMFDPGSAQISYSNGFQWGYEKFKIGARTWGWIACGTVNAKNRMGGYVGAQQSGY